MVRFLHINYGTSREWYYKAGNVSGVVFLKNPLNPYMTSILEIKYGLSQFSRMTTPWISQADLKFSELVSTTTSLVLELPGMDNNNVDSDT
jgi:hypothetical protein